MVSTCAKTPGGSLPMMSWIRSAQVWFTGGGLGDVSL